MAVADEAVPRLLGLTPIYASARLPRENPLWIWRFRWQTGVDTDFGGAICSSVAARFPVRTLTLGAAPG